MLDYQDIKLAFRRDMISILRDRRSLIFMLLLPVVLIPLILALLAGLTKEGVQNLESKASRVLIISSTDNHDLITKLTMNAEERQTWVRQVIDSEELSPFDKSILLPKPVDNEDWVIEQDPTFWKEAAEKPQKIEWLDLDLLRDQIREKKEDVHIKHVDLLSIQQIQDLTRSANWSNKTIQQDLLSLIESKEINAAVVFSPDWLHKLQQNKTASYQVFYSESSDQSRNASRKIRRFAEKVTDAYAANSLHDKALPPSIFDLSEPELINVGEDYNIISRILPYFIILSCFVGGMAPAVDHFAGEKERQTLETLFLSPANRGHLLIGKYLAIFLCCLLAGVLCMISLSISLNILMTDAANMSMEFKASYFIYSLVLLLPLAATFASLLMSLSLLASSQKQAQTYMIPLNFMIIIPAFYSLIPGTELTSDIAMMPILNVSLAIRDIWSGIIDLTLLLQIFLSTALVVVLALAFNTYLAHKESIFFRH